MPGRVEAQLYADAHQQARPIQRLWHVSRQDTERFGSRHGGAGGGRGVLVATAAAGAAGQERAGPHTASTAHQIWISTRTLLTASAVGQTIT